MFSEFFFIVFALPPSPPFLLHHKVSLSSFLSNHCHLDLSSLLRQLRRGASTGSIWLYAAVTVSLSPNLGADEREAITLYIVPCLTRNSDVKSSPVRSQVSKVYLQRFYDCIGVMPKCSHVLFSPSGLNFNSVLLLLSLSLLPYSLSIACLFDFFFIRVSFR